MESAECVFKFWTNLQQCRVIGSVMSALLTGFAIIFIVLIIFLAIFAFYKIGIYLAFITINDDTLYIGTPRLQGILFDTAPEVLQKRHTRNNIQDDDLQIEMMEIKVETSLQGDAKTKLLDN